MDLKNSNYNLIKNPLWEFSIDFYDHPGVEDLLISIQDKFNLDIIILLMCIWLTKTNIDNAFVKNILLSSIRVSSELQSNIIYNIRKSRKGLKFLFKEIEQTDHNLESYITITRNKLKATELELEALEVYLIFINLKNNFNVSISKEKYSSKNIKDSLANINTYANLKNIEIFKEFTDQLEVKISEYFLTGHKKEGEGL